jgi:Ca2+-transporting ATPase
MDFIGKRLGLACLIVSVVVTGLGVLRGRSVLEMFIWGVSLAIAAVPEALAAVVTGALAIGVQRAARRKAIVRRLPAVETLGCTTVICSDKTGTLTRNEMTARRAVTADGTVELTGVGYDPAGEILVDDEPSAPPEALRKLLNAAVLASDARLVSEDGRWRVAGDPTEGALLVASVKAGLDPAELVRRETRVHEIPFSSERRRMTTLHESGGTVVAYSKGAAEVILADCDRLLRGGEEVPLEEADRTRFLSLEREMAAQGLRVLALARRTGADAGDPERAMTFLGLVGLMDPPRAEAPAAVRTCRDAGITPIMITGDHPLTAEAIAAEIGLLDDRDVLSGAELAEMTDAELEEAVPRIGAYARVSPADKLRVVTAWQARGEVVAMTGDGVNDAPALKKADVGIAMGITGTDVSKEAAGVTLLDDNFATIVAAVEEGRIVFSNIKKYLTFLLACNVGEIVLMAGAAVAGLPLPLTAVQILYVNLATDGLPALALAVDPPEPDLMRRRPRDPRHGIFTRPLRCCCSPAACGPRS